MTEEEKAAIIMMRFRDNPQKALKPRLIDLIMPVEPLPDGAYRREEYPEGCAVIEEES